MAKSEYLGLIKCPLCGNESGTVHEQASGTKKGRRYYRCYTEKLGAQMRCGTIQCIGPEGQTFINSNMRPIGGAVESPEPIGQPIKKEPEPKPVEPVQAVEPVESPPKAKTSLLGGFLASMAEGGDE